MIYLLDCSLRTNSHSKMVLDIIKRHTSADVELVVIPQNPTFGEIGKIVLSLFPRVLPSDIVLCPWGVDANASIDEIFNDLAELCWVVVAAGNYNTDIANCSPARAEGVITVACLNKSGVKAALSNYSSDKELVWLAGTNYDVGWKNSSGTSVSAAVYAAFLAESIKEQNPELLDTLIKSYQAEMFKSLQ